MGTISRAHSSPASMSARKTVGEIGEFVGNSSTAQAFENGIIAYAQAAIELDVQLLERVRDEICSGLDSFDRVAEVVRSYPGKEKQVSTVPHPTSAISNRIHPITGLTQDRLSPHEIPRTYRRAPRILLHRPRVSEPIQPNQRSQPRPSSVEHPSQTYIRRLVLRPHAANRVHG